MPDRGQQALPLSIVEALEMDQNFYMPNDDTNASGDPQNPEKELEKMQHDLAKQAKSNKNKFLARQKQLTNQFSMHENQRVNQSKYYINNKTSEKLTKQLNKAKKDAHQKERAAQAKERKQSANQAKANLQLSFDQNLQERKN